MVCCILYQFPMAAVTSDYKRGDLKQLSLILSQLLSHSSQVRILFHWAKIKMLGEPQVLLPETLGENQPQSLSMPVSSFLSPKGHV